MAEVVLLDAGPLGMLAHPKPNRAIEVWLGRILVSEIEVFIPEIADFEVRRELIRSGLTRGLRRLDELKESLEYLPITTAAMLRAAEFWAQARRKGRPTAHEHALDADVILAGQAATFTVREFVIASSNPKHLSRFVPARKWEEINV
jgi:predicted nucleic acid-binding protein